MKNKIFKNLKKTLLNSVSKNLEKKEILNEKLKSNYSWSWFFGRRMYPITKKFPNHS